MQPFTKLTGIVAALDRVNVETDKITPLIWFDRLTMSGVVSEQPAMSGVR